MDHGYGGVSCVTAGSAAVAAIFATSTIDASFRSCFDNDPPPFLGLVSIPGAQYHRNSCLITPECLLILEDCDTDGRFSSCMYCLKGYLLLKFPKWISVILMNLFNNVHM
ncbi:hypothetical protein DITRI_Ditri20bG0099300 [Diplodiscus trichospermus]